MAQQSTSPFYHSTASETTLASEPSPTFGADTVDDQQTRPGARASQASDQFLISPGSSEIIQSASRNDRGSGGSTVLGDTAWPGSLNPSGAEVSDIADDPTLLPGTTTTTTSAASRSLNSVAERSAAPRAAATGIDIPRARASAERLKSISFSTSASFPKSGRSGSYTHRGSSAKVTSPAMSPRASHPRLSAAMETDVAESSADETTAIMKKPQDGYGGTEPGAVNGVNDEAAGAKKKKTGQSQKVVKGPKRNSQPNGTLDGSDNDEHHSPDTWWTRFLEKYGSVELENKGSVARDHLALERTFLAWLRTSLSFASIGVAVTQLFRLNSTLSGPSSGNGGTSSFHAWEETLEEKQATYEATQRLRQIGKPLGATFLGISILILLLGFHRYFESQHYVIRGKFPASRGSIVIVTFVAAALIIASLVIVVSVAPAAFNR